MGSDEGAGINSVLVLVLFLFFTWTCMKKIRTHRHGDVTDVPQIAKGGPMTANGGMNHTHYELSPFTKQPETHGTFDVSTKKKIDRKQKQEMNREL